MWVASQSGNFLGREDADFYRAIGSEMASQGFRELPDGEPGIPLWTRENADNAVLGVTRDREGWLAELDNPMDEAVLLVGGGNRRDQLYLFEDAISCWGADWGDDGSEMRALLHDTAEKTKRFVDNSEGELPEMLVTFREMLGLAKEKWPNLDHRFTLDCIERSLLELSEARAAFLEDLFRIDPGRGAEGLGLAAQSVAPWNPDPRIRNPSK